MSKKIGVGYSFKEKNLEQENERLIKENEKLKKENEQLKKVKK